MLNSVIRLALQYRLLVVVTSLVLLFYGSYLATLIPIDVFPDLDRPRVVIITECPGLATEEVETLVTQPIEIALLGANGIEAVRSQSTAGLTVIYVEFNWDVDVRFARQTVQERLTTVAGILPEGIRPQMTPPVGKSGPGMTSSRSSSVLSGSSISRMVASQTSAKLCGGMLVAIPTAMPFDPLTIRFGNRDGSTTGSRFRWS